MYTEQLSEKEKKRLRIVGILRGCIPFIGVILCIIGFFIATKTPSPTALYIRKYLLIGAIASKPFWFGIVWAFTKLGNYAILCITSYQYNDMSFFIAEITIGKYIRFYLVFWR